MDKLIKIKTAIEGDEVIVRALIEHPMDTGRQKDFEGDILPKHYIQYLVVMIDDEPVLSANWTTAISRDPYLSFRCRGQAGQKLTIQWRDNLDQTGSKDHTIT